MIDDITSDAEQRMTKSLAVLAHNFGRIRTGRAHPDLLEGIKVAYYGAATPLQQMANISVEDARTLTVTAWDKAVVPDIERAILTSDLGLNPVTAGTVIRISMPPLTEDTRKAYIRQARAEAEAARVSVRSVRRDALALVKGLLKDKDISEDDERRAHDAVQKLTDQFVAAVEKALAGKEADLLEI